MLNEPGNGVNVGRAIIDSFYNRNHREQPNGWRPNKRLAGNSANRDARCGGRPKEQHFGLADASSADLRIIWPNGEEQVIRDLAPNRAYLVRQGDDAPRATHTSKAGA